MLRWQRKHPGRMMPMPMTMAASSSSETPKASKIAQQPTSWTMLPTLEEFGVRRPLDAPGRPANLGGPQGGPKWPMMSRTMTHVSESRFRDLWRTYAEPGQAVVDMAPEQRVAATQVSFPSSYLPSRLGRLPVQSGQLIAPYW